MPSEFRNLDSYPRKNDDYTTIPLKGFSEFRTPQLLSYKETMFTNLECV